MSRERAIRPVAMPASSTRLPDSWRTSATSCRGEMAHPLVYCRGDRVRSLVSPIPRWPPVGAAHPPCTGAPMTTSPVRAAYTQWAATYDTDRNLTRDLDRLVTRTVLAGRRYRAIHGNRLRDRQEHGPARADRRSGAGPGFLGGNARGGQGQGVRPGGDLRRGRSHAPWPRADRSADLVACNLVLEHIADLGFVFAEAARTLAPAGHLLICEIHPFRQYLGGKAAFQREQDRVEIPAFVHHFSDFLEGRGARRLHPAQLPGVVGRRRPARATAAGVVPVRGRTGRRQRGQPPAPPGRA